MTASGHPVGSIFVPNIEVSRLSVGLWASYLVITDILVYGIYAVSTTSVCGKGLS